MATVKVSKYQNPDPIDSSDTSELVVEKYKYYTLNIPIAGRWPSAYIEDSGLVGGTDLYWCVGHVYKLLDDSYYINPNYFTEYSG